MKTMKIVSIVFVLLFTVMGVSAQEPICGPCPMDAECTLPRCPVGGVFTNPEWLKIDHHRVNVEIETRSRRPPSA